MSSGGWIPATQRDWASLGSGGFFPLNQTWEWGEAKRRWGARVERYVLDGRVGVQFEWRRGVAWAAAAPVGAIGSEVAEELEELARQLRRPMLVSPTVRLPGDRAPLAVGLYHSGTVLFDLSGGEDAIRSRFRKTWRNSLSKALRSDAEVEDGTLADLMPMLVELSARKGFDLPYSEAFIRTVLEVFGDGAVIRVARLGGALIGGRLDLRVGNTATSFLSATTLEGRSANTAYLLSWDGLKRLSAGGATVFDFGGVSDERSTGPSGHKLSMGGELLDFPGTHLFGSGPRSLVVKTLMRFRSRVR